MVVRVIAPADVENAFAEGYDKGYNHGLTDGHPMNWRVRYGNADEAWHQSEARARLAEDAREADDPRV